MPVHFSIEDKPLDHLEFKLKDKKTKKISLAARKTLEGNIIVQDHHNITVVIMPDKGKILALPKGEYNDDCYDSQDKLFKFLLNTGVVKPDSVNGSNIYGSLEATYITDKKGEEEPLDVVLLNLFNFMKKSAEDHSIHKEYIEDLEKQLTNPDEDDSTEFGEVPHEEFKGSIPRWGYPARGVYRYNY